MVFHDRQAKSSKEYQSEKVCDYDYPQQKLKESYLYSQCSPIGEVRQVI